MRARARGEGSLGVRGSVRSLSSCAWSISTCMSSADWVRFCTPGSFEASSLPTVGVARDTPHLIKVPTEYSVQCTGNRYRLYDETFGVLGVRFLVCWCCFCCVGSACPACVALRCSALPCVRFVCSGRDELIVLWIRSICNIHSRAHTTSAFRRASINLQWSRLRLLAISSTPLLSLAMQSAWAR